MDHSHNGLKGIHSVAQEGLHDGKGEFGVLGAIGGLEGFLPVVVVLSDL